MTSQNGFYSYQLKNRTFKLKWDSCNRPAMIKVEENRENHFYIYSGIALTWRHKNGTSGFIEWKKPQKK